MTDSQLDEIFKKQLPGYESPVPEDMWDRIIRKKDRDRKGFFLFFTLAGLFILGFVTAGILLFGVNKKGIPREKQILSDSNVVSHSDTFHSKAGGPDSKEDSSRNNKLVHGAAGNLYSESFNGVAGNLDKAVGHKKSMKKTRSSESTRTVVLQTLVKTENKATGISQEKLKTDSESDLNGNAGSKNNSNVSENSNRLPGQNATTAILSTTTVKSLNSDTVKNNNSKKQDSTKKTIGKWSVDLYASPDYPIVYGEPSVKTKLSYTVGLRINRSFGKRFSGTIGIQFSQLNYSFGSDSSGYFSPGHLKSLDLPILAGYSWGNETIGMTVKTGVIVNLYSWHDSTNYSAGYFKTNTGLSLYLGFNFSKHINERIDIFSEPYYRYRLSSMTNSTVSYLKFIDVAGLSFGVRYHFKK